MAVTTTTPYIPFSVALAESLKDPAVRAEWESTAVARELAVWLVAYREERKMTQADLAGALGLKQSAVARLEAAEHEPSMATLRRLADRLSKRITVVVEPGCVAVEVGDPHEGARREREPGDLMAELKSNLEAARSAKPMDRDISGRETSGNDDSTGRLFRKVRRRQSPLPPSP